MKGVNQHFTFQSRDQNRDENKCKLGDRDRGDNLPSSNTKESFAHETMHTIKIAILRDESDSLQPYPVEETTSVHLREPNQEIRIGLALQMPP